MKRIALTAVLMLLASSALAQHHWNFTASDDEILIRPDGYADQCTVRITYDNVPVNNLSVRLSLMNPIPVGIAYCESPTYSYSGIGLGNGQYYFNIDYAGGIESDIANYPVSFIGNVRWGMSDDEGAVMSVFVVSPDLNGDLLVNMSDVARFTQLYAVGEDVPEVDLNFNGRNDVGDIGLFVQSLGVSCGAKSSGMTPGELEAAMDLLTPDDHETWGSVKSLYR